MNGGSITTEGLSAAGIMAYATGLFGSGPSKVVASNMTIATTGENARGVDAREGSEIDLHNVSIHTTGAAADGLRSAPFGNNAPSTIVVDGGSVIADQAVGIGVSGVGATIVLENGVVVTSGLNRLMDVLAGGHVTLAARGATLNGDIFVDPASTADVTLASNTVLTGAVVGVRQMDVLGSRWTMTGDSTILGTLTNAGTIQFASSLVASASRSDPFVSPRVSPNPAQPSPI